MKEMNWRCSELSWRGWEMAPFWLVQSKYMGKSLNIMNISMIFRLVRQPAIISVWPGPIPWNPWTTTSCFLFRQAIVDAYVDCGCRLCLQPCFWNVHPQSGSLMSVIVIICPWASVFPRWWFLQNGGSPTSCILSIWFSWIFHETFQLLGIMTTQKPLIPRCPTDSAEWSYTKLSRVWGSYRWVFQQHQSPLGRIYMNVYLHILDIYIYILCVYIFIYTYIYIYIWLYVHWDIGPWVPNVTSYHPRCRLQLVTTPRRLAASGAQARSSSARHVEAGAKGWVTITKNCWDSCGIRRDLWIPGIWYDSIATIEMELSLLIIIYWEDFWIA